MENFRRLLFALPLVFLVAACGNGHSVGAGNELPDYTQREQDHDLEDLEAAEQALQAKGVKFEAVNTTRGAASDVVYRLHTSDDKRYTAADLQDYLGTLQGFLQKYSGSFNIKRDDGTVELRQIEPALLRELEAKLTIVQRMLVDMK